MPTPVLTVPVGRKVSDGLSLSCVVGPSTTIPQGGFALLEGYFGLCVQGAETAAGEYAYVTLLIEQCEYETSQIDPAGTFAKGTAVYWDAAAQRFTGTAGTGAGALRRGIVSQAKDVNNVIWLHLAPQAA